MVKKIFRNSVSVYCVHIYRRHAEIYNFWGGRVIGIASKLLSGWAHHSDSRAHNINMHIIQYANSIRIRIGIYNKQRITDNVRPKALILAQEASCYIEIKMTHVFIFCLLGR